MTSATVFEHVTLFPSGQPDDRYLGTLYYDGADPYAVSLSYVDHAIDNQLGATFARAMLIDCLDFGKWSGSDRVLVGPHAEPGHTVIGIAADPQVSGGKDAMLTCSTQVLQKFVDQTLLQVPLGQEDARIDWHAELAVLLPDRRRAIAVRQADGVVDGWATGVLTAHWNEADTVVVEVPGVGDHATWTVSRAGLACAAIGEHGGWFRLQAPGGGPELLARAADVHAFLAGVGGAA